VVAIVSGGDGDVRVADVCSACSGDDVSYDKVCHNRYYVTECKINRIGIRNLHENMTTRAANSASADITKPFTTAHLPLHLRMATMKITFDVTTQYHRSIQHHRHHRC
jgi:hypothetical protein